jgi:hypothetical protein
VLPHVLRVRSYTACAHCETEEVEEDAASVCGDEMREWVSGPEDEMASVYGYSIRGPV